MHFIDKAFLLLVALSVPSALLAEEKPKADSGDRYTLPADASVEDLLNFIEEVREYEPESAQDSLLHRRKAPVAIKDAARKILKLEQDTSSEAYRMAKTIVLSSELGSLVTADRSERQAFIEEVARLLKADEPGPQQYDLALKTARTLESIDADSAIMAYKAFDPLFAESSIKRVAAFGKIIPGAIRRLELPGHAMELKAPKFNGDDFDLAKLTGKVVLIDFWATWCGPCVAEIPNMRKLYDRYHKQGFEIVGLSVDEDREELEEFLAKRKLPWIILHDEENEGQHPVLEQYGILGYPTMFLIGKDGNVIDVHARGDKLEELLEKEFGVDDSAEK